MSAIPEPNYTQVPNLILDRMDRLSDAELRVLLVMCRQTFGYHRKRHIMSTSFLAKGSGMSEQGVLNGVKRMLERGVVEREPCNGSFSYSITLSEGPNAVEVSQNQPPNAVEGSLPTPLRGKPAKPLNAVEGNKERGINKERKGANAPASRPKQEQASQPPASPPQSHKRELTDGWCAAWAARFGGPYKFEGAKDGKAADSLLATGLPVAELLALAAKAWERLRDPAVVNGDAFNSKHAVSLASFASRFNEVRVEVATAPKPHFHKRGGFEQPVEASLVRGHGNL